MEETSSDQMRLWTAGKGNGVCQTAAPWIFLLQLLSHHHVSRLLQGFEGQFSNNDQTKWVRLAFRCLQYEPRERPNPKSVVVALTSLEKENEVPSYVLMGIPPTTSFSPRSPLDEACLRMDLTDMHEVLEKLSYKDDEAQTNEVAFILDFHRQLILLLQTSCCGVIGSPDHDPKSPCESFLSSCQTCKKNLGHGSDIFMGEKVFCI